MSNVGMQLLAVDLSVIILKYINISMKLNNKLRRFLQKVSVEVSIVIMMISAITDVPTLQLVSTISNYATTHIS